MNRVTTISFASALLMAFTFCGCDGSYEEPEAYGYGGKGDIGEAFFGKTITVNVVGNSARDVLGLEIHLYAYPQPGPNPGDGTVLGHRTEKIDSVWGAPDMRNYAVGEVVFHNAAPRDCYRYAIYREAQMIDWAEACVEGNDTLNVSLPDEAQ